MKRTLLVCALAILPLLLVGLLVRSVLHSDSHPERGENVPHVDWLPSEATRVSFYLSYSFKAYEFDIPDNAFRSWAKKWDLKKIETPKEIRRHSWLPFVQSMEYDQNRETYFEKESKHIATVAKGYYYSETRSNGGGIYVAYDSASGRAYFQSNPR